MNDFLKSLYLESNSQRQHPEQGQQPTPDYLPKAYISITCTSLSHLHAEVLCDQGQQLIPNYLARAYINMTCTFLSHPHAEVLCGLLCVHSCGS